MPQPKKENAVNKPNVHDRYALEAALQARGATLRGTAFCCLWHDDKSPSNGIYEDTAGHWRYKCQSQGCDGSGDLIDLLAMAEGTTPGAILSASKSPKSGKVRRTYPTMDAAVESFAAYKGMRVAATHPYMAADGLSVLMAITRLLTGEINPDTGKEGKEFFPVRPVTAGWVTAFPDGKRPLYRLPEIAANKSVVVCEGEKAADALCALGLAATTSAGGYSQAGKSEWLPLSGKRVVIWPDHDDPGSSYADDVLAILANLPTPPAHIARIDPAAIGMGPKGDAYDFVETATADKRDAVIAALRAAPAVGHQTKLDALLAYVDQQASGSYYLAPWPFPVLTKTSRSLLPGKVTIIAGTPGAAKSWFVLQTTVSIIGNGIACAMLALEEPWPWHAMRAVAHLDGRPEMLDNEWVRANKQVVESTIARHADMLSAMGRAYTCHGNPTMDDCVQWVEDRAKEGVRVMIIDPITLADNGKEKPWDADKKFMARSKVILEKYGASLLLVTHPRKANGTQSPKAMMDDLAGGVTFSRAAASILWLSNIAEAKPERVIAADGVLESHVIHKTIRIMKARDSTGCGTTIGYGFVGLKFQEYGAIVEQE